MAGTASDASEWVSAWQRAAARMDQLQREELKHVDVAAAIEALEDAYISARQHMEPSKTSGLVEQQALFMKGRA